MKELNVDLDLVQSWFTRDDESPIVRVASTDAFEASYLRELADVVRRCYASDDVIAYRASQLGVTRAAVVAALLPDKGSVMSGDFGEIIAYLVLGSQEHPTEVIGPKRWRLKQDRTKAAPGSDVVQFVLPNWPTPSGEDRLVCAEVKAKATSSNFTPIANAIEGMKKDRLGRAAKTLNWFKERAILGELDSSTIDIVDRFLDAVDHPEATKDFWAIAVLCTSLVDGEPDDVPEIPDDCRVAVVTIPELKARYEAVFKAIHDQADGDTGAAQ